MLFFIPVMKTTILLCVITFGAAQRVFLSSTNPTPCFGDTVDLVCSYPDVMERVNGTLRYAANTASYRMNGLLIFSDEDVFDQSILNKTASRLRVRIVPTNFTTEPVNFTCFLLLHGEGEDSASTVVDPQAADSVKKPNFLQIHHVGNSEMATTKLEWEHADKGTCYNNLIFSYNITWYHVVGGVPLKGEGQSAVTGPGATEYTITNLMNGTDYQVELFGFTSSDPVVYSEVATVNFTTEERVPSADTSGGGGSVNIVTVTVAPIVVFVFMIICVATTIILLTVAYKSCTRGNYDLGHGVETVSPAEEQVDHGMSIDAPSNGAAGDQEEQWQSQSADLDQQRVCGCHYPLESLETTIARAPVTFAVNGTPTAPPFVKETRIEEYIRTSRPVLNEHDFHQRCPFLDVKATAEPQGDLPMVSHAAEKVDTGSTRGPNNEVDGFFNCTHTEPVEDDMPILHDECAVPIEEDCAQDDTIPLISEPVQGNCVNRPSGRRYRRLS